MKQDPARNRAVLVDLPVYGVASTLFWHKRRWRCVDGDCAKKTWTEEDRRIAAPRMGITDRAGHHHLSLEWCT